MQLDLCRTDDTASTKRSQSKDIGDAQSIGFLPTGYGQQEKG